MFQLNVHSERGPTAGLVAIAAAAALGAFATRAVAEPAIGGS